jgi:protein-L-isoaspartate(D-aspartate) O-methyltransferase
MSGDAESAMSSLTEDEILALARRRMVESQLRSRGIADDRVLDAMLRVPRHEFVPEAYQRQAYEDHPLPIGEGQTISQPYIVSSMLQALALAPGDKVLEIGTGSGYVTALLAELTARVISVERHATLAAAARRTLGKLRYKNVKVIVADGTQGFPAEAPYDAITVAAAAAELPPALLPQLNDGGRLIIPVGPAENQQLQLIRIRGGKPEMILREACRFVPLIAGVEDRE